MSKPIKSVLVLLGLALLFSRLLYDLYSGATDSLQPNLANDAITHAWPLLSYARASAEAGVLPLWNPYTSLGTPYFAEIGLGLFFPLAWLVLLMDVAPALLVIQMLTVAVGMAGMYCYVRHLSLEPIARLLCVALFAFALFTETFYPTMGYSFCMLPFVLWRGHRFIQSPDIGNCCYLALTVALCFLGGFPNYFIYTVLVVGVYCACLLAFLYRGIALQGIALRLGMVSVAAVLMLGLVAVQLAPAYELSSLTYRNIDSGTAYDANSLWENFSLLLLLGNFVQTDMAHVFGNSFLKLPAGISYLGGVLLFLPLAFTARQTRPGAIALAAAGVFLCLFLLSYQVPALALLQKLPFASAIRVNGRAAGYVQFVLVVLCCIGLSNLLQLARREPGERALRLRPPALLVVAAYGLCLLYAGYAANGSPAFLLGFASCATLVLVATSGRLNARVVLRCAALLVLLAVVDISYHRQHRFLVPALHPDDSGLVAPARAALGDNVDGYRVVFQEHGPVAAGTLANLGPKYRLPSIDAYIGLTTARWENYVRYMLGPEKFDELVARSPLQRFYGYFSRGLLKSVLKERGILELASLRYVVVGDNVRELQGALPRAYAVGHYVTTSSEEESLAAIRATRPVAGDTVVIEGERPGFPPRTREGRTGSVRIEQYSANEVVLSADLRDHAIVVLNDAYYPGWVATLDGAEVPIYRANSLFRAVAAPPGKHTLVFRYRPTSLYIGFGVTLASLVILVALLARKRADRVAR